MASREAAVAGATRDRRKAAAAVADSNDAKGRMRERLCL